MYSQCCIFKEWVTISHTSNLAENVKDVNQISLASEGRTTVQCDCDLGRAGIEATKFGHLHDVI